MSAVRDVAQRYLGLLEMSGEAVLVVCDSIIVSANAVAHELLGTPQSGRLLGRPFLECFSPVNRAAISDRIGSLASSGDTAGFVQRCVFGPHGKAATVEVALHACAHRGKPAVQVLLRDISEQQRLKAEVTHLSHHDPLTRLANRSEFLDRLDDEVARATREREPLAVACFGLDNFRAVNDALGQRGGDVLLTQVAERLNLVARANDTIARLGGDEFGLIVAGCAQDGDGVPIALLRLFTELGRAFVVGGAIVGVRLSMGIAIFPDQANTPDRLMRKAMLAMKHVKRHGGGRSQLYTADLDAIDLDESRRHADTGRRMQTLTAREREVLQLVVTGKTNKIMGSLLGISARTVDIHRSRVMQKMEAGSVAELVRTLDHHY